MATNDVSVCRDVELDVVDVDRRELGDQAVRPRSSAASSAVPTRKVSPATIGSRLVADVRGHTVDHDSFERAARRTAASLETGAARRQWASSAARARSSWW